MARQKKSDDPFRWFDSSPEVIRVRGGAKVGHWSGGDLRLRAE